MGIVAGIPVLPMSDRRRARLILASLLLTFLVVRLALWRSPDSDFDVAGYNIHHLFTGLLIAVAAGIPLVLRAGHSRGLDVACVLFGVGLALALDEVVYLIATDGSNASYLLPVSFWGGVVVVGLGALWIALVGWRRGGGGGAGDRDA
jgi:hypothetical protein